MTQLAPTNVFTSQLMAQIGQFRNDYADGNLVTVDDVVSKLWDLINQLNQFAFQPMTRYEPVVLGEPPSSSKMNRFWNSMETDVNIIEDQLIVLQAATLFLHNFYKTEISRAYNKNGQAANKLKTLQLYASAHDNSITTFGDFFRNQDFIDLGLISSGELVCLDIPGYITLGRNGVINNLSKDATVTILPTSNGFLGNNQEIEDPLQAPRNPASEVITIQSDTPATVITPTGPPASPSDFIYKFLAETNRHADLKFITDSKPTTWIEYESNYVNPNTDRLIARNLNFTYRKVPGTTHPSEGLVHTSALENMPTITPDNPSSSETKGSQTNSTDLIDWAWGPPFGILKLDLEFDIEEAAIINRIAYTPYGLQSDKNYPVKVSLVQVSENGTTWEIINPQNVFVGTDANLKAANTADNVTINTAEWSFPETSVRFVRMSIEQMQAVDSNIGHLFYQPKTGNRVEGPIPPIEKPTDIYKQNYRIVGNNTIQNVEYFEGKRWAIGVRDILIQEVKYKPTSVMISKLFRINGVVDRVSIEADMDIPITFPSNPEKPWVGFFVSPNDGMSWFPISRIQDDFLGIPEILAFNDPLPVEFREQGVDYHTVSGTVNNLRVKIEITRPAEAISSSPAVRSYTLKVKTR